MADKKYNGAGFTLTLGGVAFGIADCEISMKRGVAVQPRAGKESDLKMPGKLDITWRLTGTYLKGAILAKLLNSTVNTGPGADTQLHAGLTAPGANGETVTDMTVTDSQKGVVKFQALTAAITAIGTAIIYGTDLNGVPDTETVAIPLLGINQSITGKKAWASVTHIIGFNWVQAGGTLKVWTAAKPASVVPGRPPYFNIVGTATSEDGTQSVTGTMNNCFLTSGSFGTGDADKYINMPLEGTISDADADFNMQYVDA